MSTNKTILVESIRAMKELDIKTIEYFKSKNINLSDICVDFLKKDTNVIFNLCKNAYENKLYNFNDEVSDEFIVVIDSYEELIQQFSNKLNLDIFEFQELLQTELES